MCGRYRRTTREEELARIYRIPIPVSARLADKLQDRAESGSPRDSVQPGNQATQSRSLALGLSPVLG
jgi:hypothetical protein